MGKKYNVLVTAVGAIVGYGIVDGLHMSGYDVNVIGTDIYPDAVGQYFCDNFIGAVPAADPGYINFLKNIIDRQNIDLVLFGIEQELLSVADAWDSLGDYKSRLAVNNPWLTAICNDKWRTSEWLKENGLAEYAIPGVIEGSFTDISRKLGCPFMLKPRDSRASKGIYVVDNKEDFDFYSKKMGTSFMAQQIVGDFDHEYTVGVFGNGKGGHAGSIILRRTLSHEGATQKAWVVNDAEIDSAVHRLTAAAKPEGPCNFQFRTVNGKPLLLEINPRISSSTSIRSKFGYNEPAMCIEYYCKGHMPDAPAVRKGTALRYITDWVTEE